LKLLAQLMQTAPEPSSGQLAPTIRGHIEFDSVTFHYPGSPTPAVKEISFAVPMPQRQCRASGGVRQTACS
jgi:ABC-type bacteriocin/lantibiotic exporter with double-glycine peptidase domain